MAAAPPVLPGALEARFALVRVLGRGAFGTALEVQDRKLGRAVALKLLGRTTDSVALGRFEREAVALARIRHPHVLRIFEHGIEDEVPYLVTELVEGRGLDTLARAADPLPPMLQVAEALAAVHEQGIVHRDVKPANVLCTPEGRAVLIDFGLVHFPDSTRLTQPQEVLGTMAFMSPEVFWGATPARDHDWYAWAGSLFFLYERVPPHSRDEIMATIRGAPFAPVVFPEGRPPPEVQGLIRAMLDGPPEGRLVGRERVRAFLANGGRPEAPAPTPPLGPGPGVGGVPGAALAGGGRCRPVPGPVRGGGLGFRIGLGIGIGLTAWVGWLGVGRGNEPGVGGASGGASDPVRAPRPEAIDELERELARGTGEPASIFGLPGRWLTCPAYRELLGWLAAGGRPEDLPAASRVRIRALGRTVVERGGPDPFTPWFDTDPGGVGGIGARARLGWVPESLRAPELGKGWLVRAWEGAARLEELDQRYEAAVRVLGETGARAVGMPEGFEAYRILAMQRVQEFFESLAAGTEGRNLVVAWSAAASSELLRFLWAVERSIEEEPEHAERAAALARVVLDRYPHYGYMGWLTEAPGVVLPLRGETPAGASFRAAILQLWAGLRRTCRLGGGREEWEPVLEALGLASQGDAAPGTVEALRIGMAAADRIVLLIELGRADEAVAWFGRYGSRILGLEASGLAFKIVGLMLGHWERGQGPSATDRELVLAWGERNQPGLAKSKSGRDLLVRLAALRRR